jgi:hypothetical protein
MRPHRGSGATAGGPPSAHPVPEEPAASRVLQREDLRFPTDVREECALNARSDVVRAQPHAGDLGVQASQGCLDIWECRLAAHRVAVIGGKLSSGMRRESRSCVQRRHGVLQRKSSNRTPTRLPGTPNRDYYAIGGSLSTARPPNRAPVPSADLIGERGRPRVDCPSRRAETLALTQSGDGHVTPTRGTHPP